MSFRSDINFFRCQHLSAGEIGVTLPLREIKNLLDLMAFIFNTNLKELCVTFALKSPQFLLLALLTIHRGALDAEWLNLSAGRGPTLPREAHSASG